MSFLRLFLAFLSPSAFPGRALSLDSIAQPIRYVRLSQAAIDAALRGE